MTELKVRGGVLPFVSDAGPGHQQVRLSKWPVAFPVESASLAGSYPEVPDRAARASCWSKVASGAPSARAR
jgi:hypothetical protein